MTLRRGIVLNDDTVCGAKFVKLQKLKSEEKKGKSMLYTYMCIYTAAQEYPIDFHPPEVTCLPFRGSISPSSLDTVILLYQRSAANF